MTESYTHEAHFERVYGWCLARDLHLEPQHLPRLGFVADGKAVAFLIQTDSPIAWIANFCCDPALGEKERDELFGELLSRLETAARSLGYQALHTCAKEGKTMQRRIAANGYHSFGLFEFFAKGLGE